MATGDIYRLSVVGDWGAGYTAVNTFHFKMISNTGTPQGACAYLKTAWVSVFKGQQDDSFFWRSINWLSINLTPAVSGTYTTGFPIQGARAGVDPVAFTNAMVVTLRTAYTGRAYRGRLYLPGFDEGQVSGSTFDPTLVPLVQTYLDDMVAAVGQGGANPDYQWGVYSHKLSAFNAITETVVRSVVATQRRRRPGVGV